VAESEWWNGLEVIWGFTWGYVNIQVRAPTIMRDLMGYNPHPIVIVKRLVQQTLML
jgi:hypothetical protein